jgi:hypothetical protein
MARFGEKPLGDELDGLVCLWLYSKIADRSRQ